MSGVMNVLAGGRTQALAGMNKGQYASSAPEAVAAVAPGTELPDDASMPAAASQTPHYEVQVPGARRNLSKSATRALDVLDHFAKIRRPMRAVELGQALGYQTSSADQLLKTMVDAGYLVFDPKTKLYFPSPRLMSFGAWLEQSYYGEHRLRDMMAVIHGETGAAVTLAVRQGNHMQLVDLIQSPELPHIVAVGSRIPILGSALGHALMAGWSDQQIDQFVRAAGRRHLNPERRIGEILQKIAEVRRAGFAGKASGTVNNIANWSIAIRLPTLQADVQLTLGITGPERELRPRQETLAQAMRKQVQSHLLARP
jgi:DNA-binding IclR family transcriptional regulator